MGSSGWGQIDQAEGWCRNPGEQQGRHGGGALFCEVFRWEWLGDGEGEGAGSANLVGGGGMAIHREDAGGGSLGEI